MEEDIKIMEEFINYKNINNTPYHLIAISHERLCEAIENLISRYKELEEKQNKNIQVAYGGRRFNTEGIVIENYIPKSKIKKYLDKMEKRRDKPKFSIMKKEIEELLD